MRTEVFESKASCEKAMNILEPKEAPLKGFIFPVDFERR